MPRKPKKYPRWVNPRHLLIGDVQYRQEEGSEIWAKWYWTGKSWASEAVVPPLIKRKGELRANMVKDQETIRKGRVY